MKREFSEPEIPEIAREVLALLAPSTYTLEPARARILALAGDLGAGKTTLTKELAKQLGISETVISPTYVIMKSYPILASQLLATSPELLIHIDAYRLENDDELTRLGWNDLIANPKNLIIIEWPEKVKNLIPDIATWIQLTHTEDSKRTIEISN